MRWPRRRAGTSGARRALLRRYPYATFYRVRGALVEVLGCTHMHRDPRDSILAPVAIATDHQVDALGQARN